METFARVPGRKVKGMASVGFYLVNKSSAGLYIAEKEKNIYVMEYNENKPHGHATWY